MSRASERWPEREQYIQSLWRQWLRDAAPTSAAAGVGFVEPQRPRRTHVRPVSLRGGKTGAEMNLPHVNVTDWD